MLTAIITLIFVVILLALTIGLVTGDDDFAFLFIWSIIVVGILYIISIFIVNQTYSEYNSKIKITPEIKVETTVIDNKVSKSDTTYIYRFKND